MDDLAPIGLPPGAAPRPAELTAGLAAALRARGPGYRPRTHHLDATGAPRYTNRLILETSPYLLQHAHNPVDWYGWSDEPFARARAERRPVLLSVGYSTCHWCHVMERESFEDEEIARALNERYVCVKVDREERPDVDAVYMAAVQALSGGGGWPMTVWLTAEREPFFGGTYFPPRDGARGMRRGFLSVLEELADVYQDDPLKIAGHAQKLAEHVRRSVEPPPGGDAPSPAPLHVAARQLLASHDPTWGGFGGAPKFPRSVALEHLLRYARRTGSAAALAAVETTLDRMARGGVHDQIGGGFHRYSTDARWLVPHFEKMLYDNALLAVAYLEGWQATGRADFARTTRRTLDYLLAEMRSPEGGFYSATDADTEGEEGRFFVWSEAELDALLPAARARVAKRAWGVTAGGNWEGSNVLWLPSPPAEVAAGLGLDEAELARELEEAARALYAARALREPPLRDEKILAGWNGLAISAFAQAALALGERRYLEAAAGAARFLVDRMIVDGPSGPRLHRSYKDGQARHAAVLEDHAFVTAALLDLHEATQAREWLVRARALAAATSARFADRRGGFFATADDAEPLLAREKPDYDGAIPSGNGVAVTNLLRLAELGQDEALRDEAARALTAFSGLLARAPSAAPRLLGALDRFLDAPKEIVLVAPGGAEPRALDAAAPMVAALGRAFVPSRSLLVAAEGADLAALAALSPLAAGKVALGGAVTAYVCRARVCDEPTTAPTRLVEQATAVERLPPSPLAV